MRRRCPSRPRFSSIDRAGRRAARLDKFNVRANAATGGHHEQGRSRLRHPIRVHAWGSPARCWRRHCCSPRRRRAGRSLPSCRCRRSTSRRSPSAAISTSAANTSASPARRSCRARSTSRCSRPKDVQRPYPLVLIHGAAQTATNWMGTPDGRKGWAEYFVEQGYVVYMIDQPMRGRSAWHPGDGATRMFTAQQEEFQFTADRDQGHLAAGEEAHAVAGRRPEQGPEGRSDLRRVLRHAGRDRASPTR